MPKTATATVREDFSPTTFQEVAEHTMVSIAKIRFARFWKEMGGFSYSLAPATVWRE